MPLRLEDKKSIVAEVSEVASQALSLVAAEYSGISVKDMTSLRQKARAADVHVQVVRNTLARRALEGTTFACVGPALVGPLVLAFSLKEPGAAARLFRDFTKQCEQLEVKALSIDGALLPASQLEFLATIPSRDEALATFMMVMKASVTKLARTMAEPCTQVVRVISAKGQQQ